MRPDITLQPAASGITRRVGFAEDVNWVAGLERVAGESVVGKQREIGDREQAYAIEYPSRKTFHPAIVSRKDTVRETFYGTSRAKA